MAVSSPWSLSLRLTPPQGATHWRSLAYRSIDRTRPVTAWLHNVPPEAAARLALLLRLPDPAGGPVKGRLRRKNAPYGSWAIPVPPDSAPRIPAGALSATIEARLRADPDAHEIAALLKPSYQMARLFLALRELSGLSQAELSRRARVSLRAIISAEGARRPCPTRLSFLASCAVGAGFQLEIRFLRGASASPALPRLRVSAPLSAVPRQIRRWTRLFTASVLSGASATAASRRTGLSRRALRLFSQGIRIPKLSTIAMLAALSGHITHVALLDAHGRDIQGVPPVVLDGTLPKNATRIAKRIGALNGS
jgi:transcriptional regulator with XRE-family HTH domain